MAKLFLFAIFIGFLATGCTQKKADDNASLLAVKDSITLLTANTAKDITARGPIAWLDYFENSPEFYMANDGVIAFKNYSTAQKFIKDTLVKHLGSVKLQFSDVRIIPLNSESGSIGAAFKEELTITNDSTKDKAMLVSGYFSATAHHTSTGWRYLNLHWSIKK